MEKSTFEQMGGTYYQQGDYFLPNFSVPESAPVGIWGVRHLCYLKKHRQAIYTAMLLSDKLNSYLAEIDQQAQVMFSQLVKQIAGHEKITEHLKESNQLEWVRKMNNVGMIGANLSPLKYDMVVSNPPYMKMTKDSPEAKAMPDVCYGAPNLYFLFAAMGLFNLIHNGELVYIIPRSWTSGAYFKRFRQKFLSEGTLQHIHLFVSRDKVFDKESVLQETIIIKVRKSTQKPSKVAITTTQSNNDFSNITTFEAPYTTVISGEDCYVYLVTNEQEVKTLEQLNQWGDTLPSIGLRMKTGLTVDFRNKDVLRDVAEDSAVPLFYSQHIQAGKILFPIGKEHEYIATEQVGLLQPNANYLFVKRFTAKEEHRRLQCGVYLARKYPEYANISTQNKINFISGLQNLSECIVYGLYVLFNSTLYDCYYRILNGSTQVNSTEINSMPVPPLASIESMGKELIRAQDMTEECCDQILRGFIYEQSRGSKSNTERVASAS